MIKLKRKKHVNKLILFITVLLIPINVLACPHIDSQGESHLQIYNDDYTEMTMIYPEDGYLYSKDVLMGIDGALAVAYEDELLFESFGFPIMQSITSYITYYWFLDETLLETELDDVDVEATVENYDKMTTYGINYFLEVGLSNTYDKGITYETDYTDQIFYDVFINKLNEEEDETKYSSIIDNNNLILLADEIFDVTAEFLIIELENYVYSNEYIDIDDFYDDITINVYSDNQNDNAIVLNLNNSISEEYYIDTTYNESENYYSFTITESGVYIVVDETQIEVSEEEADIDTEDDTIIINTEDNEKEDYTFVYYIIGGIAVLASLSVGIILAKRKK